MSNDIKSLIDEIIGDTRDSYPGKGEYNSDSDRLTPPTKFDKGEFKEKLSMGVLKDVVSAMMQDDTENLDEMIDNSISQHLNDNYGGSSYNYLTKARDNCNSPMLADIIQEIDDKTTEASDIISKKKDPECCDIKDADVKEMVSNVDNYDEFREKIKQKVSEQVVDDVAKVVTTKNDAPVFDDLDEKLEKADNQEDITSESVILKLCGSIVSEAAIMGNNMSVEEGINRASIGYCIAEMDRLFKNHSRTNVYTKYNV